MATRPELLSPAGDPERLQMAVRFGANAVYLAGKTYGMRGGCGNFTVDELCEAVKFCHARGVRVHVTCNTLPREDELSALPPYLEQLADFGADALIVADLGVFRMAQKYAPGVELHISTQSGIVNADTAAAWYDLGASRVVLARELSLDEILKIRSRIPKALEIETFVHGSMCVSFSGRCLLSNYMTGRDANRGQCAQPCRWKYALMEQSRPGEYFPVYENDTGTYIMNSKDLCMIDHIPELLDAGIDAFKIEGRNKSSYYAAIVTNAYQRAIDAALAGKPLEDVWRRELDKVSHRNYYTGFYYGRPEDGQFYADARYIRDWQISAIVRDCDAAGNAVLSQRNRFSVGDELELIRPGCEPIAFRVEAMQDGDGVSIDACPHAEQEVRLRLPVHAEPYSILRREAGLSPK